MDRVGFKMFAKFTLVMSAMCSFRVYRYLTPSRDWLVFEHAFIFLPPAKVSRGTCVTCRWPVSNEKAFGFHVTTQLLEPITGNEVPDFF